MMQDIAFGPWLPDMPGYANPGLVEAKNLVPEMNGYAPWCEPVEIGEALPDDCLGAVALYDSEGNPHLFAGTATRLYKRNAGAWQDVTRPGMPYNLGTEQGWQFVQYGDRVLAANGADPVQSFLIGTDAHFDEVDAYAPAAQHLAVINNFIMAGHTAEAGNLVQWSGLDAPTSWERSAATQADFQRLENEGGAVQAVIGHQNYGIILQEYAIVRMEYVGPPEIFTFAEVERRRGALTGSAVTNVGQDIYYLAEDGFYRFDGVRSLPIGEGRVNQWFFDLIDRNYLHRIQACADPVRPLVIWSFPEKGQNGLANRLLVYHTQQDRWSWIELESETLLPLFGDSYRLEDLDAIAASLETLPYPLDSRVWQGKDRQLAFFTTSHRLANFNGEALQATLLTGDIIAGEQSFLLQGVMPAVTGGDVSVRVGGRAYARGPLVLGGATAINNYGWCDSLTHGCSHAVELTLSGDWEKATGMRVGLIPAGKY
ncbi:hypothetical protein GC177_05345 [bacterium]|nr:hypothetical protein [bacterium]